MIFVVKITIIWSILIMLALPLFVKVPKQIEKGHADSAPDKHYVGWKLLCTLLMSILIAFLI